MAIAIAHEPHLPVHEFVDLLHRSTLAQRRPVANVRQLEGMLRNADLVITARDSAGLLVGVARAITDYSYCTYLSDLAVDRNFQRQGLGRLLVTETHQRGGLGASLVLLAAPQAASFYQRIGMQRHDSCWRFPGR